MDADRLSGSNAAQTRAAVAGGRVMLLDRTAVCSGDNFGRPRPRRGGSIGVFALGIVVLG